MPEPLQKQTLIRLGLSVVSLILLVALIIFTRDVYLWIPCAGAALFFAAAAFLLFRRAILGEYVVVTGECSEVGVTAVRRRVKQLILQTDAGKVKVMLGSRLRKISAGTEVRVYVANNTPIYEQNGLQMLYSYLAMDVVK